MDNQQLDDALVEWDIWRERNANRDFDSFVQEYNLNESVCAAVRRTLNCGVDVGKMAVGFQRGNDCEFENNLMARAISKDGLAEELGDRFDIKSRLGVGGMGTVWLAEQSRPIRRKVAIKLIRNDLVSPATRKRFAFEQQALASLSHRNIATVHEAGETESGRSYFIMEYIPGEKITDFCNRHKLDLAARLKLFMQVCDGVQYAHRRGLIHRDLKPGNVIVMEESNTPVAKVIDFGLAKDTEKFIDDESLTQPNAVIGSPAWMSPEQAQVYVDGEKAEVDTRTDVYSLGVILYQLLTNSTPIPQETIRNSPPAKIFHSIRHQLPTAPSRRLGERKDDSKNWLEDSSDSNYSAWVSNLKDDLDWVVLKAIEKDASRRYENVGEFAGDIQRFVEGKSVTARPPSRLYHFKKIVGRNKILASSIAVIAATLIVATCISTSFAIKANRAQKLAERRLRGSEQLTAVFASGFKSLSYLDDAVENTELKKELLREVGKQMEATAADFPPDLPPLELAEREYLWRSEYLKSLTSALMDVECVEQLEKIMEFLTPVVEPDDERLVDSRIRLSRSLYRIGDIARAKKIAVENLDIVSTAYSSKDVLALRSEIVWLAMFIDDRTFEENEANFKKLIELANSTEDGVKCQLEVMQMAATHAFNALESKAGIDWLNTAQTLANEKLEKDDSLIVDLEFQYWMQVAFSRSGKKVDLELLETRVRDLSNSLGHTHPTVIRYQITLARILNVLSYLGVVPEERPLTLIHETLETSLEGLGPGHQLTSDARYELLRCLTGAGKFQDLLEACDEHLDLLKKYSGENSDPYRTSVDLYLNALLETGKFEVLVEQARLFQRPREEATALVQLGRLTEATRVLTKYIEFKTPQTNEEFVELITPHMMLAQVASKRENYSSAIDYLKKADEYAGIMHVPSHQFRLKIREKLRTNYKKMGKMNLAIQEGKGLLNILLNHGHTMPQELRTSLYQFCLSDMTEMQLQKRDFQSAKKYASLYFESPITHKSVQSQSQRFKFYLGVIENELGNEEKAEQLLLEAWETDPAVDSSHPLVDQVHKKAYQVLQDLYRKQGATDRLASLQKEKSRRLNPPASGQQKKAAREE